MTVTRLVVALISVLSLSTGALAVDLGRENVVDTEVVEAKATVKKYQEMRKLCSVSLGASRRDCFAALHDANSEYKEAKKMLAALKGRSEPSLHLVTYAE